MFAFMTPHLKNNANTSAYRRSSLATAIQSATRSPNLFAFLGQFAGAGLFVRLRALYGHLSAWRLLRLLFLVLPSCYGFVMRFA
jgi:hypothetical protein